MNTEFKKAYIISKTKTIELFSPDGLRWFDGFGTEFALRDNSMTLDLVDRCGVGLASLPPDWDITDACRPHDYKYTSVTYQLYHNRSEADADLERDINLIATEENHPWYHLLAEPFKKLANWFGGKYWEDPKTRDK